MSLTSAPTDILILMDCRTTFTIVDSGSGFDVFRHPANAKNLLRGDLVKIFESLVEAINYCLDAMGRIPIDF